MVVCAVHGGDRNSWKSDSMLLDEMSHVEKAGLEEYVMERF